MIAGPVRKERRKAGKESAIGPYREGYFPHLPKFILPADEASDGLLAEAVSRPQRRFGGMALEAGRRNGQHDTRTHVAHCGGKFGKFTVSQRSEEHTSELQSLMRTSYAVFCLKKKKKT